MRERIRAIIGTFRFRNSIDDPIVRNALREGNNCKNELAKQHE